MSHLGIKYASGLGGMILLFVNFVACGSQLYQVSMQDDVEQQVSVNPDVNDPAAPTFGLHAPKGWKDLPIRFVVGHDLTSDQRVGLMRAMNTWETAVGRKLFVFEGVQPVSGDSFSDLYSSLDDGINGHYLDGHWDKTGKPKIVLATTIWDNTPNDLQAIRTADIRFNSNYYVIGDSFYAKAEKEREVVDMETLSLHELGHLLGLAHIDSNIDRNSIMAPALYIGEGLANRRLSRGDIERVQKIYGCQNDACDIDQTLVRIDKMGQPLAKNELPDDVETESAH